MGEGAVDPTIGISVSSRAIGLGADRRMAARAAQSRDAIGRHGAASMWLTPQTARALDRLDGLLLAGGGDIDSSLCRYDAQPDTAKLQHVDRARDECELELCRSALAEDMPILGICRGAQVLGVALGGSLLWDIESQVKGSRRHREAEGRPEPEHWIEIAEGSRLSAVLGRRRTRVNSAHHQANSRLGQGVTRAAWCEDGVAEAIELTEAAFVLGVQWHPERMAESAEARSIFAAFVAAARDCRLGKG